MPSHNRNFMSIAKQVTSMPVKKIAPEGNHNDTRHLKRTADGVFWIWQNSETMPRSQLRITRLILLRLLLNAATEMQ